jgi:hypothetical protein
MLDYLLQRPLAIDYKNALLVHAGAPPQWGMSDVLENSKLVEKNLQSKMLLFFYLRCMEIVPYIWDENHSNEEKSRYAIMP